MSLENSEYAQTFVEDLRKQLEQDNMAIRETDLNSTEAQQPVLVLFHDGGSQEVQAVVDKLGRVHISIASITNGHERSVVRVSTTLEPKDAREIVKAEPRYEGETQVAVVLTLE